MLAFGLAILTLGLPTAPTFVVAPLPSGATEVAFDHIGSVDRFTLAVPPSAHVELPALGTRLATGVATIDGTRVIAVADVAGEPNSLPHSP